MHYKRLFFHRLSRLRQLFSLLLFLHFLCQYDRRRQRAKYFCSALQGNNNAPAQRQCGRGKIPKRSQENTKRRLIAGRMSNASHTHTLLGIYQCTCTAGCFPRSYHVECLKIGEEMHSCGPAHGFLDFWASMSALEWDRIGLHSVATKNGIICWDDFDFQANRGGVEGVLCCAR